jgi:hypothetical protein
LTQNFPGRLYRGARIGGTGNGKGSRAQIPLVSLFFRASIAYLSLLAMSLAQAILALAVLGKALQMVPLIGDQLQSATDVASHICELAQVRIFIL